MIAVGNEVDIMSNEEMRVACATGSTAVCLALTSCPVVKRGVQENTELSYPNSTVHCHPSLFPSISLVLL